MRKMRPAAISLIAIMLATATPASAAIPVIDPSSIARIRESVTVATQQLSAVREQVAEARKMSNLIGRVGRGDLQAILKVAGLDFSGPQGALNDVLALGDEFQTLTRDLERTGVIPSGTSSSMRRSIGAARDGASQIFYTNQRTADALTRVRDIRSNMLRETGINGFALATTTKGRLEDTSKIAEKISTQAGETTDLRQDVQVNTAAILALLAETAKQTAIQAQLLEIEATRTLASDTQITRGRP